MKSKTSNMQHLFKEIGYSNAFLENLAITSEVDVYEQKEQAYLSEALQITNEKIYERLKNIMSTKLTSHQLRVANYYYFLDYTYQEIADTLNINYTTIPHCINGIYVPRLNCYHGGIRKKLTKLLKKDEEFQLLFGHRRELIYKNNIDLAVRVIEEDANVSN